MNNANITDAINVLSRAVQQEEAQHPHGSSASESHNARLLGEMLCASINDPIMADGYQLGARPICFLQAVRDLPDKAGFELILTYRGKARRLTLTFDDLAAMRAGTSDNFPLLTRLEKALRSPSALIADATTAKTPKATAKKRAAKPASEKQA